MSDNSNKYMAYFWSMCDTALLIHFYENDLKNIETVKRLFWCGKSAEPDEDNWATPFFTIYPEGWEFLIKHYGYETLFEINREVEWLNTEDIFLFKADIQKKRSND
ncbi:MAG: hypothetical protein IJU14_04030 [Clostridia bacterium]|nr:hypothetical protein [Clostridia bacterium]